MHLDCTERLQLASEPIGVRCEGGPHDCLGAGGERGFQERAKFPKLYALLKTALSAGSKAIVWTSFTANADWLARELKPLGTVKVHGKMAISERHTSLAAFKQDKDCKVLVATPGAAKEGLTLTVAN